MAERTIDGLDGVLEALQQLPKEIVAKNGGVVNAALRKGAVIVRNAARSQAPVRSGALRNNIALSRDRNPQRSGAAERYRVGVRGGAEIPYTDNKKNRRAGRVGKTYTPDGSTYYWRFIEFGTEKMSARPFLRPAFESSKEQALAEIVTELGRGIHKAAKKVARLNKVRK